jgi:hypothetical protein
VRRGHGIERLRSLDPGSSHTGVAGPFSLTSVVIASPIFVSFKGHSRIEWPKGDSDLMVSSRSPVLLRVTIGRPKLLELKRMESPCSSLAVLRWRLVHTWITTRLNRRVPAAAPAAIPPARAGDMLDVLVASTTSVGNGVFVSG